MERSAPALRAVLLAAALSAAAPAAGGDAATPPAAPAPAGACPHCAKDAEPLAIVDGAPITRGEYKEYLLAQFGDRLLETLVNERLVRAHAERLGIRLTPEEERQWLEGLLDEMQAIPEYRALDRDEVRRQYASQLSIGALLDRLIKARRTSEEGLRREYEIRFGERRRARHILFQVRRLPDGRRDPASLEAARKRAEDTLAQISNGGDFGEFARRLSEDPGTRERGGELPEFGRNDVVPEFAAAAFSLREGEIGGPVLSPFGWHIIQVTKVVPAARSFDEVKEQLRAEAARRPVDREEHAAFLRELREKAHVEIRFGDAALAPRENNQKKQEETEED